ncbi:MAG: TIGR02147 family protein [Chitinivibrionales bacterium]|jgi:uncharacterized protein (TIGR02147 family)
MVSIYNYTDYRKFLRDRFAEIKAANRSFTYRYLASKAGFKSPGFFTQVLQEKVRLSERLIPNLSSVFELKPSESHYFELMVHYNQAQSHELKKQYFEKMVNTRKSQVIRVDSDMYEFYDKWYYSAIRAVLHYSPFDGDYKKLAKTIVPPISPAEAKKAVLVLDRLGFVKKNEAGSFELTTKHISTGVDTDAVVINNFLINTLDIAKNAFYQFPKEKRSFSALTASISGQGYEKIRNRINEFRAELVDIIGKDSGIDRVYQMNFQLFPLTNAPEEEKR